MATGTVAPREYGIGRTGRSDAWWAMPATMALGFGGFIIYATFRAFQNADYHLGVGTDVLPEHSYLLSPFYSPLFALPAWMPRWFSPALFVMWAPAGFRLTCYYGRRAYYRALLLDPPACAVAEACSRKYQGETRYLLFQNLHRYFLYVALCLVVMHVFHVIESCRWPTADGGTQFGISLGTLVLATDVFFLAMYTFSCHSLRHLIGGGLDCFSASGISETRHSLWRCSSAINRHHGTYFWISLFTVGLADFYVWMAASGRITDLRIL